MLTIYRGLFLVLLFIKLVSSQLPQKSEICTQPKNSGRNSREYSTNSNFIYHKTTDTSFNILKWPWMVSIGVNIGGKYEHACAGVIVTKIHILTTAYCLDYMQHHQDGPSLESLAELIIRAGDGNLESHSQGGDDKRVQTRNFKKSAIHGKYNYLFHYYDVAVIELQTPLDISTDFVRPVYLPTIEESRRTTKSKDTDILLVISGWNRRNNKNKEKQLRDDLLTSFPDDYCSRHYHGTWINHTKGFTDDVMCGGNPATLERVCIGDEGSPIVKYDENQNRYVLVGLSSMQNIGASCNLRPSDSILRNNIFTRIASLEIISFIYKESCNYKDEKIKTQEREELPHKAHEYADECGINNAIVAMKQNQTTKKHLWPWQVSIGYKRKQKWKHFCGGVIIAKDKIVTAAHCLSDKNPKSKNPKIIPYHYLEKIFIRVGDFNLDDPRDDIHGVNEIRINAFRIHSNYSQNHNFDVATIELKKTPLTFSQTVRPICSFNIKEAKTKSEEADLPLITAGWGFDESDEHGKDLRETLITTYDESYCNKTYNTTGINLTEELTCAGDILGYSGTCRGDSGSASVHFDPLQGRYFLRAIVSGSPKGICGTAQFPNTYVRMTHKGIITWLWREIWIEGPNVIRTDLQDQKNVKIQYICHSPNRPKQQIHWLVRNERGIIFQNETSGKNFNLNVINIANTNETIITLQCTDTAYEPPDRVTKIVEILEPLQEPLEEPFEEPLEEPLEENMNVLFTIICLLCAVLIVGLGISIFKYWGQLKDRDHSNEIDLDEATHLVNDEQGLLEPTNNVNDEEMLTLVPEPTNIEETPQSVEFIKCLKCGVIITGRMVQMDEDEYLHPECLRCGTCGKVIEGDSYHKSKSGSPLCFKHYMDEFKKCCKCGEPLVGSFVGNANGENYHKECLDNCCACGNPVSATYVTNTKGQNFHEECLKCYKCGIALTSTYKRDKNGRMLCQAHYQDGFKKCCKCGEVITGSVRINGEDKNYHPNCFKCIKCNLILSSSYFMDKQDQPLCQNDYLESLPKCVVCQKQLRGRYNLTSTGEGFHEECDPKQGSHS